MRIWDIDPKHLCRNHLLGEHRELHAIWSIITKNKKGYSNHPETNRWKNKLGALFKRHELLIEEMEKRSKSFSSIDATKVISGYIVSYLLSKPNKK